MERMKCRHQAILEDGLPNVYVQVGPRELGDRGFDGCVLCLVGGFHDLPEAGLIGARGNMAVMLDGLGIANDPDDVLYRYDAKNQKEGSNPNDS